MPHTWFDVCMASTTVCRAACGSQTSLHRLIQKVCRRVQGDTQSNVLSLPSSLSVSVHIRAVREAEERGELTERERRHVQALLAFSEGDLPRATHHWAHILIHHPRDLLAVKLLFGSCIHLGEFEKMRNSLAGVMPHWSQDMQSYPFLLAL